MIRVTCYVITHDHEYKAMTSRLAVPPEGLREKLWEMILMIYPIEI